MYVWEPVSGCGIIESVTRTVCKIYDVDAYDGELAKKLAISMAQEEQNDLIKHDYGKCYPVQTYETDLL